MTAKRDAAAFRTDDDRWRAVRGRDERAAGVFVYGVTTTGIACRPGCPSRAPQREHVGFFETLAAAERIGYAVRSTALGWVGLAWTARGLCDLFFVERAADVDALVRRRWPAARLARAARPAWIDEVVHAVERPAIADVPLDIQGTAFQERVWRALLAIPRGETRTYGQVAEVIGAPGAARAVGRAVGRNRIAVLVPCHRVVGAGGRLGGYRWGLARKRELLRRERALR